MTIVTCWKGQGFTAGGCQILQEVFRRKIEINKIKIEIKRVIFKVRNWDQRKDNKRISDFNIISMFKNAFKGEKNTG